MLVSNIAFVNFTGYLSEKNGRKNEPGTEGSSRQTTRVSCSNRQPCYNIEFRNVTLQPAPELSAVGAQGVCKFAASVHGMAGQGC